MLCPPNDWTNDQRGGYLTEEIRQSAPLVRRAGFGGALKQGTVPLTFLNNLQQPGLPPEPRDPRRGQLGLRHQEDHR